MTTIHPPDLVAELKDHFIFLDTGVFITASKSESFVELLIKLRREGGCSFSTIPAVLFEFTNGSETLEQYNKRASSLDSLVDYINPMRFINDIRDFYVVMAKINDQNKSQTDLQLAACLYNYRRSPVALLTTDLKAYPSFFPRTHVITVEQDNTRAIRNLAVYQFDRAGYAQSAKSALSV